MPGLVATGLGSLVVLGLIIWAMHRGESSLKSNKETDE